MNENKLSPLQIELLNMLSWFDSFCRKNGLRYYAVGGTLLGAVRHKGFIPWDDDIDVAMPREDYNQLAVLMQDIVHDHYVLETQESDKKDFCYPYYKLYDINTTLVENYAKPLTRGIFLDIFPLDGVGENEKDGLKWYKKIQRKYDFYLTRVAAIRRERRFYKNCAIVISRLIPDLIIDNIKLRKELNEMCQKYSFSESKWGGNLLGNWGEKEIVPLEIFDEPREYSFENIFVYGPQNYDKYLTYIYGNWRKLPPKDKQISHHDYLELDLNSSYIGRGKNE